MAELARENPDSSGLRTRALNQAAREILLAQSSDWAFIMKTGTARDYAVNRTYIHIERFNRLYSSIKGNSIDESWLRDVEEKDNIFSYIDYRIYR
jgi:1,4-alpha-glucan branching enzyme